MRQHENSTMNLRQRCRSSTIMAICRQIRWRAIIVRQSHGVLASWRPHKWRAKRTNGVDERLITGEARAGEKFQAWAATVPATLRNPLYPWTHLELRDPFGYHELLNAGTSQEIYRRGNERLAEPGFTTRGPWNISMCR